MRIFYDATRNTLFVEGTKAVYPAQSLVFSDDGNLITISIANGMLDIANSPWDQVANQSGSTFSDIASVRAYLTNEFSLNNRLQLSQLAVLT